MARPHVSLPVRLSRRSTTAAVALATAASFAGFAAGPSAHAETLTDVKRQIAQADRQLSALDAKAEAATERYNAARIRLSADQQRASSAQRQLAAAQKRLAATRAQLQAFAVAAYQGSSLDTAAALTADSPQQFLDKITTLEAVSNSQSQSLAQVAAAQHAEEQAQALAQAALAQQQAATRQMQADRAQIVAAAHQQEQILARLKDKAAALERAARLRAERIAAQRAAAALAAREAAAARAAQQVQTQPVSPPPPAPAPVAGSGGAKVAVQWAYRELGKPYQWGAAGPDSFDCSGLTMYVWGKAGVHLDHYTGSQWNEGQHVSQSQLQPGDLVFFGSDLHHVGIYIGNGNMIEAPHTGANVRISPYLRPDYAGAVRPGT